jgi:PAS domain-containing protein
LVGHDLRERVPALRDSVAWDFFRQVMRTGEMREFTVRGELHGQTRVRFRAFPYDGGGVGVIFGAIAEREEAEMWRKRWIALAAGQPSRPYLSVITLNARGVIKALDENFCALSGFRADGLIGRPLAEILRILDVPALLKAVNAAVESGRPQEAAVTLITSAGVDRSLDLRLSAIPTEMLPEEIIVSIVDLTHFVEAGSGGLGR